MNTVLGYAVGFSTATLLHLAHDWLQHGTGLHPLLVAVLVPFFVIVLYFGVKK